MVGTPEILQGVAEWSAALLELMGLGAIVLSALAAAAMVVPHIRREGEKKTFEQTRLRMARGILLGLEFLVAADIIRTVTIKLSFSSVGVLAAIVAIRTFLSFSLEAEMSGRWPWSRRGSP